MTIYGSNEHLFVDFGERRTQRLERSTGLQQGTLRVDRLGSAEIDTIKDNVFHTLLPTSEVMIAETNPLQDELVTLSPPFSSGVLHESMVGMPHERSGWPNKLSRKSALVDRALRMRHGGEPRSPLLRGKRNGTWFTVPCQDAARPTGKLRRGVISRSLVTERARSRADSLVGGA